MSQGEGENESAGVDSFLDVISNFVGILIILVMVVGQRARDFPFALAGNSKAAELAAAHSEAAAIEAEVGRIADQAKVVQAELAERVRERGGVETVVTAVERELAERRAALDEKTRGRYDAERDLALARAELEKLEAEKEAADKVPPPETIKIESYPTPLSQTVNGKEAHFHLLGGRLAYVPWDLLEDELRGVLREEMWRLRDEPDATATLGPIGGFNLRYFLERVETSRGTFASVSFVILPTSSQLGEPMDVALAPHSRFRDKLEMLNPQHYTITVWTYPDSFADFRRLKKELYQIGYSVAARPLPEGTPMGASPTGTKSSAQ